MNKRQAKKEMKKIFARIEATNKRPEIAAAIADWKAEAMKTWPMRIRLIL